MLCLFCWSAWHFRTIEFISRISYSHIMQFCSWMRAERSHKWPRPVIITSLASLSLTYQCHPALFSPCRGVYCISLSHWGWISLSFRIQHSHYEMTWFCSELWIWFKLFDRRLFFEWIIIRVVFSGQSNNDKSLYFSFYFFFISASSVLPSPLLLGFFVWVGGSCISSWQLCRGTVQ